MFRKSKFKLGQTVRVKDGYRDEEMDISLTGWHGRITELRADDRILCFALDSITLRSLPPDYVETSEEDGLDWTSYYIGYDDVEPARARDTQTDVETAVGELAAQAGWAYLGEEGRAINEVLADIDIDDTWEQMKAWRAHFEKTLKFPFGAVVDEWQGPRSLVRGGDRVRVVGIEDVVDDMYGVLVHVKRKSRRLVLPLCDLKALDEKSVNYEPVYLYALWFANR